MSMSTYDALQAWAAGEMPASRAMVLTNTLDLLDLYALAAECDGGGFGWTCRMTRETLSSTQDP
jgi:hypothetical protein